jgi:hypothetical protein
MRRTGFHKHRRGSGLKINGFKIAAADQGFMGVRPLGIVEPHTILKIGVKQEGAVGGTNIVNFS